MVGNIVDVGWATIKSGCLPITAWAVYPFLSLWVYQLWIVKPWLVYHTKPQDTEYIDHFMVHIQVLYSIYFYYFMIYCNYEHQLSELFIYVSVIILLLNLLIH
jgi:hypothetical protein